MSETLSPHEGVDEISFVTARVCGQLVGIPILRVHDVFEPTGLTHVPLSPREVRGVLNLRGRIVTIIDLAYLVSGKATASGTSLVAIGVDQQGESYGILVDAVEEVCKTHAQSREPVPTYLSDGWRSLALGVHRMDTEIMVMLDLERVITGQRADQAA